MAERAAQSVQRLDQWLWFARITKSRTLAQALIVRGKVRLNRSKIEKVSQPVKSGDVLTVMLGTTVRTLEILAIGARRGPAAEAQLLFRDLTPVPARTSSDQRSTPETTHPHAMRAEGAGRPTKRERRLTDRLKGRLDPLT